MAKSKMIAKSCPKCDQQVAVATKSCKCGHSFFSARARQAPAASAAAADAGGGGGEERRRTGRVRRARPHFYDSQDYQRQKRKVKKPPKRRSVSQGSYDEDDPKKEYKDGGKEPSGQRGRRRSLKLRVAANDARAPRAPAEPVLDPARLMRCSALLHEINRKMAAVTWSPGP